MNSVSLDAAVYEDLRAVMDDAFADLVETFIRESAKQLIAAQEAWDAADHDAVRRNAHSLKGSAANIGALKLNRVCAELERCARDGNDSPVPALIRAADTELDEVTRLLRAAVD